jgi:hypothetical protein
MHTDVKYREIKLWFYQNRRPIQMLTDIKHSQNKLCFFTEKEAETDAHR